MSPDFRSWTVEGSAMTDDELITYADTVGNTRATLQPAHHTRQVKP
jgi:hypothetical protein